MTNFRDAVLEQSVWRDPSGKWLGWGGQKGSSPPPFDNAHPSRLAGPGASHPLALLNAPDLLNRCSAGLNGVIELDSPAAIRIGGGISGKLNVTATRDLLAQAASMRIVGCLLVEQSVPMPGGPSNAFVVAKGTLIGQEPYSDTPLPTSLSAGQQLESSFIIPAPRLGPPSAHLGLAIVAWAVAAHWDLGRAGAEHVAEFVDIRNDIDYLRSGAVHMTRGAMMDQWDTEGASISVSPSPPVAPGQEFNVTFIWPGAPPDEGRGARVELQASVRTPSAIANFVLFSQRMDPGWLRAGGTLRMAVPPDSPPTFSDQGVSVSYKLRLLVDRTMRSDVSVERELAVM